MTTRGFKKLTLTLALAWCCACLHPGKFVWIDEAPAEIASGDGSYQIEVGDMLGVQVWDQDQVSRRLRVRSDGRISLPLINDIEAAGRSPALLAREIELKLKKFIVSPQVTVLVEESKPLTVSVVGEVSKAGLYPLDAGAGVLQAIASAGGLNDFADRRRIFVLRQHPLTRIRFTYKALVGAEGRAASFRLQNGDVVVVE